MSIQKLFLIPTLLFTLSVIACWGDSFSDKYSSSSARAVLAMGDSIRAGHSVSEDAWKRIFETDGYKRYLSTRKGDALRSMIKEAVLLAFSPARHAEADSMLRLSPNTNDYQAVMSQNICKLAKRQDEAMRFITETDFPALLSRADLLVRKYIPQRATQGNVVLNNLYLICTIPDASVREKSVMLDINLAMDMTEEEIVRMLAHEFFHNYREATLVNEPRNSFWKIFNSFENEGIADLIDKGDHPETLYARYGASVEALYLNEYKNSSHTLQKLDSLLSPYLAKPIEGEYAPVADLLVFNGHPTGYYMTRLIREEGLEKDLIKVFDSPAAFAELYNKAASRRNHKGGNEYIISKDMISYLYAVE